MSKRAKLSPFKVMTSLLNETKPTPEEIETLNSFFLCRWFSNNPHTVAMGNMINLYYNMPLNIQYKFCEDYIELTNMKNKVKFINASKDKQNKDFEKLMENIQKKYKVNEITALEYFELMDNDERNKIYNMYDHGRV